MDKNIKSIMADDDKVYFSVTLTAERTCVVWNFAEELDLSCHKLAIKQIVLGAGANHDEYNVVVVNTAEEEELKIPIAILKADEICISNPDLEFVNSKVTFTLIEGSGPIHIYGHIVRDDADFVFVADDHTDNYSESSHYFESHNLN